MGTRASKPATIFFPTRRDNMNIIRQGTDCAVILLPSPGFVFPPQFALISSSSSD